MKINIVLWLQERATLLDLLHSLDMKVVDTVEMRTGEVHVLLRSRRFAVVEDDTIPEIIITVEKKHNGELEAVWDYV